MTKTARVLIGKPGLDGHEAGSKVVARMLFDAGFDVIYTGVRQTPEMIVRSALEEDVDVIGLSLLSGAHYELCSRILDLMKVEGVEDIPVIVGGIIPADDIPKLQELGVKAIFGPGSGRKEIVGAINAILENMA
ncbi:MAG: cobalamin B12-binding domain-containing protein [Rhodospirillales bacterium]|jgi:methylmalonyl-CoA mutase C-terminal domain/subunit|nr:cobalamin B12-binding domain-containing protein [Rhodospirillales bacterium]|tara:strand:- start:1027 stop:1428 length:402 start_codon:yes stop_codon:yes gene_type:complete